jgi:phosphoglycerate dehydrogenase-like enzyme
VKILFGTEHFSGARSALQAQLPHAAISASGPAAVADVLDGVDVLVPFGARVDASVLDAGRLQLVQQFGAGLDGVDLDAARDRGIPVANVPSTHTGNAAPVAEVALLHLLALSRRYHEAIDCVRSARVGEPVGRALAGRTLAVVGMGAVGRAVEERARAFGMIVIGVGRRPRAELLEVLAGVDAVVLCCPLTDETRGLIGEAELAALREGALLVNVARGAVVDYASLLAALRSGRLAGAGLDVFWDEPFDPADPLLAEVVTTTPHIAGVTVETNRAVARWVAENVERLRRGEPLQNRVV